METSHLTQSKFTTSVWYKNGQTCVRFQVLSCVTVLECDTVLLSKKSLTLQRINVCSSSGSSSILQLLDHLDEGTIILQNVSNVSSNNTASWSKIPESSWADLLMIEDLVYRNHLWSSHFSARRWTIWVQKSLILRHSEVIHVRWFSLQSLDLLSTSKYWKTWTCIHAPSLSILQRILKYIKMERNQKNHVLAPLALMDQ
jgi:hypothetical protein